MLGLNFQRERERERERDEREREKDRERDEEKEMGSDRGRESDEEICKDDQNKCSNCSRVCFHPIRITFPSFTLSA